MTEDLKLDEFCFLYGLRQIDVADAFGIRRQNLWQKNALHPSVIRIDRKNKEIRFVRLSYTTEGGRLKPDQAMHVANISLIKGKKRRELS